MIGKNKMKCVTATLLLGASLGIAGCSDREKTSEALVYAETQKSNLEKPMDNQPESSYWFPEDLLSWDYTKD